MSVEIVGVFISGIYDNLMFNLNSIINVIVRFDRKYFIYIFLPTQLPRNSG